MQVRFFRPENNFVFISSERLPTNLGGVEAYDRACNRLAVAAGINTPTRDGYIAAISSSDSSFQQRLRPGIRGWVRMDGKPFTESVSPEFPPWPIYNSILFNERLEVVAMGEPALTGNWISDSLAIDRSSNAYTIDYDEFISRDTCKEWTSSAAEDGFLSGYIFPTTSLNGVINSSCSGDPVGRVICLGNVSAAPVILPREPGKRIWVSSDPLVLGDDTPDVLCEASRPDGVVASAALVASTTRPAGVLIAPTADYVLPDGRFVARGEALLRLAAGAVVRGEIDIDRWQRGPSAYVTDLVGVWTGAADILSVATNDSNCGNWSDLTATGMGASVELWEGKFWSSEGPVSCVQARYVHCVEL